MIIVFMNCMSHIVDYYYFEFTLHLGDGQFLI